MTSLKSERLYGIMAECDTAERLVESVRAVRAEGYIRVDAYSPFPIPELDEALAISRTRLPLFVFIGGVLGAVVAYAMQYYASVVAYPLNVGGRPLHSWPAFIPVTFEMSVLVAALTAVLAMLGLNGLPMPNHPVFNVERFALASRDRFFLCIEATDPKCHLEETKAFLRKLPTLDITEVPNR